MPPDPQVVRKQMRSVGEAAEIVMEGLARLAYARGTAEAIALLNNLDAGIDTLQKALQETHRVLEADVPPLIEHQEVPIP